MTQFLLEVARVVRSKNAGPNLLTIDIIFKSAIDFGRAVQRKLISPERIETLYRGIKREDISIVEFAPANAIKITLPRRVISGDFGDTDIYGTQQYAPLLGVAIPCESGAELEVGAERVNERGAPAL